MNGYELLRLLAVPTSPPLPEPLTSTTTTTEGSRPVLVSTMLLSLFEAMAEALVERPDEGNAAESVSDRLEILPIQYDRSFHVGARSVVAGPTCSLLEVDANAFYDSSWTRPTSRVGRLAA